MSDSPRPPATSRKPWPMKWVVVAILVCVVPYTWLTLRYRKPGKPFEPYADMKEQANVLRLRDAGFLRLDLEAALPSEAGPLTTLGGHHATTASITATPGGLPAALRDTLVSAPLLPASIAQVAAAAEVNPLFPYPVEFLCAVPNNQEQLVAAHAYLREGTLVLVTELERIDADLLARSRENRVRLTLPAGALASGTYDVLLVGTERSAQWRLVVH